MASKRVETGIAGFDEMIGGGFEDQSINLIAGGSGSGKSIFALQFLLHGLKKGEKVLFVSFEEKKEDFYENMKNTGWDLEKAEQTGRFIFMEYSPEKMKVMLDEGGGGIESSVIKNKISRLVIDSITSFSMLFGEDQSKHQAAIALFDILRKWECTTLLTVQYDPTDDEDDRLKAFEFESDSITLLYYMSTGSERQRFVEVLKMRGTKHSKEIHVFKIDKGIQIGPKANVKGIS